jgi:hypothetical protein
VSDQNPHDDIDKLLAEVDRMTGDRPAAASPPAVPKSRRRRGSEPVPEDDSLGAVFHDLGGRGRSAVVAAAVAYGGVFVIFALLPFFGALSGAAGAALAAFVTVLLLRRR